MQTKLLRFRVQNFRSIQDSGWLDIYDNTCLIGTNESGKTNLLVGLWKLFPANDEQIVPLIDYPRKKYIEFEDTGEDQVFVSGHFQLPKESQQEIKKILKAEAPLSEEEAPVATGDFAELILHRTYGGNYIIEFPLIPEIKRAATSATGHEVKILNLLPRFVYYSDYGNLDSEIYLPYVIDSMARTDLGTKEREKARSLKVLFEFVKLAPQEILELGKERKETSITVKVNQHNVNQEFSRDSTEVQLTPQEIEAERTNKKKREILLQSASTKLTAEFRAWWQQGEYRFRFQADGNHFRIWVSDDLRPEEVELEGRSKGLQWFFSFFLIFLVESRNTHAGCILLLDEPGLSLHPVAQQDLLKFFSQLSADNQLIYTTHSPFLVSSDNLANVKAVYVDDKGLSSVSADLRKNSKVANKSIYPVYAAIGLTVAETLLLGSDPILVEGHSDQIYLQKIKNYLSGLGKYQNPREMIFIPTGGVRGMSAIISIISAKEGDLPYTLLDSDKSGKDKANSLRKELYKAQPQKVIEVENILNKSDVYEVEDLLPGAELARFFSRRFRGQTDDFSDHYVPGKPIVPQMEMFAAKNNITLDTGWKVELAYDFHNGFASVEKKLADPDILLWTVLFEKLMGKNENPK